MAGSRRMLEFHVIAFATDVLPAFGFQPFDNVCAFHVVYFCATP
nr:hypothetical protein [Pistricoccus aurantiacus]